MSSSSSLAEEVHGSSGPSDSTPAPSVGFGHGEKCQQCPRCLLRERGVLVSGGKEVLYRVGVCTDVVRRFVQKVCRAFAINALPQTAVAIQVEGSDPGLRTMIMDPFVAQEVSSFDFKVHGATNAHHVSSSTNSALPATAQDAPVRCWLSSEDGRAQVVLDCTPEMIPIVEKEANIRILEARPLTGCTQQQPSFDEAPLSQTKQIGADGDGQSVSRSTPWTPEACLAGIHRKLENATPEERMAGVREVSQLQRFWEAQNSVEETH